ncbi:NtaA/DmoA family FMN-dependent monooxygenase [Paramixta manurensis]|uniref:NtaA/DmoA family FMN-dependent monooxygenase n=1 Tax=Paramixta manurensis TaxID=2740817 RepID=A0A6M8UC62_9GAMM|nr:NtaA/DmoA family FMN-dependent monooxygenase [Erwiniaceae bacterium PD-1]
MSARSMILNLFFYNPQGDYRFSWRHPDAPEKEIFTLDFYADLARQAEAAKLDAIFVADHVAIWDSIPSGVTHYANARLEPLTLLSALAAVTKHIGLMGTASSSYNEPYNIARYFASLDFLSNGRASWNVVTSWQAEEAANFGLTTVPKHDERYQRADEFIRVVTALWQSWQEDAILYHKQSGHFAAADKVNPIHHQGDFFNVRGPLTVPRPPQGQPLIVQAGSSEAGKTLATRYADLHFTFVRTIEEGLAYRADINHRLAQVGRTPESFKIIAGVLPIVVESDEELRQREALIDGLVPDEMAIDLVSSYTGLDLRQFDPDQPLPPLPESDNFDGIRTHLEQVRQYDPTLSIRELGRRLLKSDSAWTVAGNAEFVADRLTEMFQSGAADGFNLMFPLLPGDFTRFTEQVVPLLQQRGVFHQAYPPGTLRDRLGLSLPQPTLKA